MRSPALIPVGLSLLLAVACGEPRALDKEKPSSPKSLPAPSKLVGTRGESLVVTLSWKDNSEGETGFGIERKTGTSGVYELVKKIAMDKTTFLDPNAMENTEYRYRIYAFGGTLQSAYSNVVLIPVVNVIPAAPSDLSVVIAAATQMQLTWTDNADTETGFKIERKSGTGAFSQVALAGADAQTYLDTGLESGSAYVYRVAAYNDAGDSAFTNEATVGCFAMGDPSNFFSNAIPVHTVCLNSAVMDPYEVTNAQYRACMTAGQCTAPADGASSLQVTYSTALTYASFPVIHVDRSQALSYCQWAGKRLPTEAEWEISARGGLDGKLFPHGDAISCAQVNYRFSGGSPCVGDTTQVGAYAANAAGLYDMAGNVWEWVSDWYDAGYYALSPVNNPQGPASGTEGIIKGGSWNVGDVANRVAIRYATAITTTSHDIGFRCIK